MVIDYPNDNRQIGDLLKDEGIDVAKDFNDVERIEIIQKLADYLLYGNDVPRTIEIKNILIKIDGRGANDLISTLNRGGVHEKETIRKIGHFRTLLNRFNYWRWGMVYKSKAQH